MKKILFTAVISAFLLNCNCQEKKEDKQVIVPELVKKSFAAKYPTATKVEWDVEENGEFEAEFDLNKSEMSVLYNANGDLLETEIEINESELPQSVKAALAKDFAGYELDEFEKTDAKGLVTYEIEAKKDKKEFELVFDASGKLIKQEEEKEKDDKK